MSGCTHCKMKNNVSDDSKYKYTVYVSVKDAVCVYTRNKKKTENLKDNTIYSTDAIWIYFRFLFFFLLDCRRLPQSNVRLNLEQCNHGSHSFFGEIRQWVTLYCDV